MKIKILEDIYKDFPSTPDPGYIFRRRRKDDEPDKFGYGDLVRVVDTGLDFALLKGRRAIVEDPSPFVGYVKVRIEAGGNAYFKEGELKLITAFNNLVKKILDSDTRTLIKAGFLSDDLSLTEEGVKTILGILFFEKKAELVKIAEEKIAEEAKK